MQRIIIRHSQAPPGFRAVLLGPGGVRSAYGTTKYEAIGRLVQKNRGLLRLIITEETEVMDEAEACKEKAGNP